MEVWRKADSPWISCNVPWNHSEIFDIRLIDCSPIWPFMGFMEFTIGEEGFMTSSDFVLNTIKSTVYPKLWNPESIWGKWHWMVARVIAGTQNLGVSDCLTFGAGGGSPKFAMVTRSRSTGSVWSKGFSTRSKVEKLILPLKKVLTSMQKPSIMFENLGMKKFETALSIDLKPVMYCVGRCSARNFSNRLSRRGNIYT